MSLKPQASNPRFVFVTVGGHMPFDRLIRCVDDWAKTQVGIQFLAQIGPAEYTPHHMESCRSMPLPEYREAVSRAEMVIAHAGMGTIISCLQFSKPMLLLPRRAHLGETRTDHQVDTAKRLNELGFIEFCEDESVLSKRLEDGFLESPKLALGPHASSSLLSRISQFVNES